MTFRELGLCPQILTALEKMGYETPSPIQEKAIPPALTGQDVLGLAQTGTGKTCAFSTPILQQLSAREAPGRPIRALILTPTRELAIQIGESFQDYGKNLKLRHTVIFGGVGQNPQVEALRRGVDILIATPGRLMDLHNQGFIHVEKLEIFVLDEADRMLDMGFIHDVKKVLQWLPAKKQTMLFSATMPPEITSLVNSLLKNPVKVAVDPVSSPVELIQQWVCFVDRGNKTLLLAHLMDQNKIKNALVFTRTKHAANKVARDLVKEGISAAAIHGNKSQTARQQALADFKSGSVRCLVATDIAARGLDIEDLSHVVNYNLSEVPETYVHRIGRTGRAGRGGEAIAFCDFGEKALLKDIEKLIGRKVPVLESHPYPMLVLQAPKRDKNGKVINEDDLEARDAARDLRRTRLAEQKVVSAGRSASPAATQPRSSQRPSQSAAAPSRPAATQRAAAPARPARPKQTRSGAMMDTGSSMPRTEMRRPNPLDSDTIMDATARMLATRKPQSAPVAPRREAARPAPARRAPTQPILPSEDAPRTALPKKATPAPQDRRTAPGGTGARNSPRQGASRRGAPPEPPRRPQTKDSTEQPSLMKPYYLNNGR